MEPEQERRLGNCPKPDSEHDHYDSTTHPAGLRTVADPLLQSKSTISKFATFSHCLANRRIRDPYVRWCVRLSLRCLHLGAVYSIMGCLFHLYVEYVRASNDFNQVSIFYIRKSILSPRSIIIFDQKRTIIYFVIIAHNAYNVIGTF